jgi:hypothetical protein
LHFGVDEQLFFFIGVNAFAAIPRVLGANLIRLQGHLGAVWLEGIGLQHFNGLMRAAVSNFAFTKTANSVGRFNANLAFVQICGGAICIHMNVMHLFDECHGWFVCRQSLALEKTNSQANEAEKRLG